MEDKDEYLQPTCEQNLEGLELVRQQVIELGATGFPCSLLLVLSGHEGDWRLAYGELIFGLEAEDDVDWNWSNFRLIHRNIDHEDIMRMLEELFSSGNLAISVSEIFEAQGDLKAGPVRRSASKLHRADWPVRIFGYHLADGYGGDLPKDDLVGHDLPYYPDARSAIAQRAIWAID